MNHERRYKKVKVDRFMVMEKNVFSNERCHLIFLLFFGFGLMLVNSWSQYYIKLLSMSPKLRQNKLECLSPASFSDL